MRLFAVAVAVSLAHPAAAPTIKGYRSPPVPVTETTPACRSLADTEKMIQLLPDKVALRRFTIEAFNAKRCFMIEAGTEVYLDETSGFLNCIRPTGELQCAWTLREGEIR